MKISVMKGADVMSVIGIANRETAISFYWELSQKLKDQNSELTLEIQ